MRGVRLEMFALGRSRPVVFYCFGYCFAFCVIESQVVATGFHIYLFKIKCLLFSKKIFEKFSNITSQYKLR